MNANDVDKINTEVGSFTLGSRTTWKYSEAVSELQEHEKAAGIAKQVTATILSFRAVKSYLKLWN